MKESPNDYWAQFWLKHKAHNSVRDLQSQVLRTRDRQPIDEKRWEFTLATVSQQLQLNSEDVLLDLCCGNGLFTSEFSRQVSHIEAVDISLELTQRLISMNLSNAKVRTADIRDVRFPAAKFSKVLWYAGIQYIDDSDIVAMIKRIQSWMKPGGVLLIGDIPDRARMWQYFNSEERRRAYFDGVERRQPIIGNWLDRTWLEQLCIVAGFRSSNAIDQHEDLIYSDFRFDFVARI